MSLVFSRRRYLMSWQLLLLILGTTWLWAPALNSVLSGRVTLISDYETPHQPYSWLFRTGDALAGLLIAAIAGLLIQRRQRTVGAMMLLIGLGAFLDPLLPTTCRVVNDVCQESSSIQTLAHGVESVITGVLVFALTIYDSLKRKKLLSWSFALLQLIYGIYFLIYTVQRWNSAALYQFLFYASTIAWLAWLGRDSLAENSFEPRRLEFQLVKSLTAAWAFINGVFAIVISLAHLQLVGRLKGLYFPGDNAWLGQHGVIVGVVMLYLSRHLARGERRARQLFLAIVGLEALKYSVITPNFGLLALYSLTFAGLFIFRDDFDRGTVPMTWEVRFRDLYFMVGGLLLASGAALLTLDRDDRTSIIASRTFRHFSHYVTRGGLGGHSHVRAVLLAHTVSAFLAAAAISILWILFRPYKTRRRGSEDYARVEALLQKKSGSSEDYFKLWPRDKQFFWADQPEGFIAYKIAGSAAFALADPITMGKKPIMLERFLDWTRERRLKVCFLPVYPDSLSLYEAAGLQSIQIGASAVIDIGTFLSATANDKWWRWQKNRATKKGYLFSQSKPPHSAATLRQLKKVSNSWLKVGGHSEYGFALGHFDEQYLNHCQLYYLTDTSGQIIAFTNRLPQFNQGHTVTVDLLRYLPQFNNSMPFLIYKTIEAVGAEGDYKHFDLGFVPFAKSRGPIVAIARTLGGARFSARGLEQFKNKFDPLWQPNYMAYEGDIGDLAAIALHLERAMTLK